MSSHRVVHFAPTLPWSRLKSGRRVIGLPVYFNKGCDIYKMGKIIAVCKSKKKGTRKKPVAKGILKEDYGLVGDAHADCCTHRQVSLLAIGSIDKMRRFGLDVGPGDFAENLTIEEINLLSLPVGTRISVGGEIVLEITQIGKDCHTTGCAIYRQTGKCIMPKEGVFTKVIKGGLVKVGDTIRVWRKPTINKRRKKG
jgi:MOSC domain-containing protein YiiM